ncbi:hypothetical protein IFM89_002879 [Coptis chinensis]|uniref:R13L1/DRL21-like LRR repeat region domain-containing protein n=1 Tax=Coptis chinensis TaxID=261450 RepID=A0A835IKJ4_9MAGN|nr:hypothetical protein IFM89_002879 [Coptis chinensis]
MGEDLPVEFRESLRKHTNLRTLRFNSKFSLTEDILSSFKCLRVLWLQIKTGEVPSSIGKLKRLRYLRIESDSVTTVPNSITKLQSLESLVLLCRKITLLPGEIWKLQKLEHIGLREDTVLTYMPSGLSHLTSIRTLRIFFVGKGIGCKLNELNGLIHLKGLLRIFNLENVSSVRDCVEANLKGKHNLETLHLEWNDEGVNRVKIDFDVLGNLEPHRNLKVLGIKGYTDNRFPRWMMDPLLPNLVVIILKQCRNCQNLPALGQLPSLKDVHLEELDALQFIEGGSVVRRQREWFPSLEKIYLIANPYLESWVKEEEEEVSLHSVVLLSVRNCPKLSTMPILPSLEELTIEKCSEKLMLSLLKMHNLEDDMDGLTSLCTLEIQEIPNLVSIPKGLQNATALKEFIIFDCESLLHAFPEGILLPTTLEKLWIVKCDSLMSWPNGLGNLTSLVDLGITCSRNLQSLPEEMRHLTALKILMIGGWDGVEPLKDLEKYDLSIFLPCDFPRVTRKTATIGFLRWKQEHVRRHLCICCPPGPSGDLNDQYHSSETAAFGEASLLGWFKLNFVGSSKEVCMGSRRVAGFGGTISNSDGPVIKPYAGSAGEVPSVDSEVLALWNGLKLLSTLPSSPVWIVGHSELVVKWRTIGH